MSRSVLSRYLVREAGLASLAVTLVLAAVLITTRLARLLGDAAGGDLPAGAVSSLLGLALLANAHVILPAGLFLGLVLAFGRLYRDSEMAAFAACGVGPRQLYRSLLVLALPLALLTAWLSLALGPWAQQEVSEVRARARQTLEVEFLRPGRFLSTPQADGMLYVGGMDPELRLTDVFAQVTSNDRLVLVTADSGQQRVDPETGERFLVLENGYRLEGVPGTGEWRQIQFREHGIRVPTTPISAGSTRRKGWTLPMLLASGTPADWAQIQWRLSTPLMVLLLAFIAVPLSKSEPREGRYGKVLAAVLVFAVYTNLLGVSQDLMEDDKLPPAVGLWWVHGLALAAGLFWLKRRFGGGWRRRR